jgi:hypothetical protein
MPRSYRLSSEPGADREPWCNTPGLLSFGRLNAGLIPPSNQFTAKSSYVGVVLTSCAMCEKCAELDKKIERFSVLSWGISDERTVEKLKALIEHLRAQKRALHPEIQ